MEVLWVTSNLPDPTLGGGPAHEFELLRWAAAHHEVTVLSGGLAPGAGIPPVLAPLGLRAVLGFSRPRPAKAPRPVILWRSIFGRAPYEFRLAGARVDALLEEARRHHPDLVQVVWAETAPVARDAARRGPTAFFASDAFSRHEVRELAAATTIRQRLFRRLQLRQTRRWERTYRTAGAVAVASPLDAAALRAQGVDALVVPSALGDEWYAPPTVSRDTEVVSFIAALDYGPNRDAVEWLLGEIWPRLQAERPSTRLRIVGRNPSPALRAAVARAGAELHADVPDIRPKYWETGVAIIPVRLGSGMRNKVLHAVACGAPVVATTTALEGIPLDPGSQVQVADDAAGLVAACAALLRDPVAAGAMADRARPVADAARTELVGRRLDELWQRAHVGWDR